MFRENSFVEALIFRKLNRKLLCNIIKNLSLKDLSRLNLVCRRFNNLVQYYVTDLQILVNWDEEYDDLFIDNPKAYKSNFVILNHCSPGDFIYPNPPFKYIKSLYLCYEDKQTEKINLTKLVQLKYLKIRGPFIKLSSNRLPSVTHVDLDDPNNCEKQVFLNLQVYKLKVNIEDFRNIYNMSGNESIKYVFKKSLDILLNKEDLEHVKFTVIIPEMYLLLFEQFNDSLTNFLDNYKNEINRGLVSMILKHQFNYEISQNDRRRWEKAWYHLNKTLQKDFSNFDLTIKHCGT